MFPASSGVLFFGAEGTKPVTWDVVPAIPALVMNDEEFTKEQSKIFATMRDSPTVTMNCHISKKGIENLMKLIRGFKVVRGPARNRMISRAKKM